MPSTKRELIAEIRYKTDYTIHQVERVWMQEYYKIPGRNKFYSKHAAIKRLQWMLATVRENYKMTYEEFISKETSIT